MSQVSKQKTDTSGRLAVVGDRELVIGYRLIGIDDTFIVSDEEDASKKIEKYCTVDWDYFLFYIQSRK